VVPGTPLTINAAPVAGGTLSYTTNDFNGPANTLNLTLLPASAAATNGGATLGYTIPGLTLNDTVGGGLGTLNVNTTATAPGAAYTMTLLTDLGLTNLNITGSAMLNITAINATGASTSRLQSTSLTISDNDTSVSVTATPANSTIGTLFVNTLSQINYSGTKSFNITAIDGDGASGVSLVNANTGTTGVLTIGAATLAAGSATNGISDNSLTSLRLTGSVQASVITANTANVTVSGATDNQRVHFTHNSSTGTGDTITLGNGANVIVESGGATVNAVTQVGSFNADTITLGSGANNVTGGLGADTVTFAAHGSAVTINLSAATAVTGTSTTGNDSGYVNGTTVVFNGNGFNNPTSFSSNSISTSSMDVYTGLRTGDFIQFTSTAYSATAAALTDAAGTANALKVSGTLLTNLTGLTGAVLGGTVVSGTGNSDNGLIFVRGVYSSLTQTFNGSSTGADSLMVYDANPTSGTEVTEGIILVGYVPGSVTTLGSTATAGLITLG
jgi:hypothetical protein